jgi:glycosyltransferase involved in cell wall biosynthesis
MLVENLPVPLDRRVWQEAGALRDAGWSVTVIGPRGAGEMRKLTDRIDGIEVLRYPQRPASSLAGYLAEYVPSLVFTLAWLVRTRLRHSIDVIHGCNPPDLFWLVGLAGRTWGARYVFDQHDANPELSRTKFGDRGIRGRALHILTTWLERRSYRTAALVITPNDSYSTIARGRGEVPAERLTLVRNAPNVAAYRAMAAEITPRPHAVGYVGVMGSQDGLDILIDAWALVVQDGRLADAHLELVGDGEARSALERQVARLGIGDAVTFHGFQNSKTFVPLLASCSLCVSPDPPTPFNDVSTMVKVVDYLAVGRAMVAFDLKESRLVAGDAAEIVSPPTARSLADAMIALLTRPARLRELEQAAVRRVAELELDWAVSAGHLVAAYRRLISEPPPEPS